MARLRAPSSPLLSTPPAKSAAERSPFWWLRWVPTVIVVILLLDLLYVVGQVAIVPVLASFGLAYVLNPLVERIEGWKVSRSVAAMLAIVLVIAVMALFAVLVIPDLWNESMEAGSKLFKDFNPANGAKRRAQLRQYSPMADRLFGVKVQQFFSNPQTLLGDSLTWTAGNLTGFLATASRLVDLLLIPFFVFYILADFRNWRASAEDLIPPRFRGPMHRVFDEIGRILQSYVLGQLMIAGIMGVLYAIGFAALKVPAWAGIAMLSGLLNVIPYIGTGAGIVLAVTLTWAQGGELWRLIGILLVFSAVQMIEGYYLTPRILGGRLSLHPMAVFLGLLIGGNLFGLLGILLAIPSIAIVSVLIKLGRELYRGSHFYHAGDVTAEEAASPHLEEQLAKAADTVLTEQVSEQSGDELLAPDAQDDDVAARRP